MVSKTRSSGTSFYVGGSRVRFTPFMWPVYKRYEIITMAEYGRRQNEEPVLPLDYRFRPRYSRYLSGIIKHYSEYKIIVPDYSQPPRTYDVHGVNNLVTMFARLHEFNKFVSDQDILGWVHTYGLPFQTTKGRVTVTFNDYDYPELPDDCQRSDSLMEFELETFFGHYVMEPNTFSVLVAETHDILSAFNVLMNKEYTQNDRLKYSGWAFESLTRYLPSEVSKAYRQDIQAEWSYLERSTYCYGCLPMMIHHCLQVHLTKLTPSFVGKATKQSPFLMFAPSWHIPDLWTALMLHIYNYIVTNQPTLTCPACGRAFFVTDRQKYCPIQLDHDGKERLRYPGERSICQNKAAVAKSRDKAKKEKEAALQVE